MKTDIDIFEDQRLGLSRQLKEILHLKNALIDCQQETRDQFKSLVIGIISIIDTFEKSLEMINEKKLNTDENSQKIINRFMTVLKKSQRLLQRYGVSKIEFPENKLIVGYCNVIDTEPDPNLPNDTIIEIVRNGYIRSKELIREAEVIIVKN